MKPVTDPALLERLNAAPPPIAGSDGRVTDPALIERLESEPSWWDSLKSMVTGEGRGEFDLPELGTSGPSVPAFSQEGMTMLGAYTSSVDPAGIADIAVKTLPGATKKADKQGNPIVTFEGQDYYVNKPGASQADALQLLAELGKYAPAARVGGAAKSLLGRMLSTGLLSGATSVGSDVAAQALGSEQPVDLARAGITAAGGALFEGLSPVAARAWRSILGKSNFFANGQLTDMGRKAAEAAGLDPAVISERLAKQFAGEARRATDPKTARTMAESTEFDIPYTQGQVTRDFKQLAREESTRHGAMGDDAGNIIRDFDRLQRERIEAAADRLQEQFGGGTRTITRPAQAGEPVEQGLRAKFDDMSDAVDEAYRIVRDTNAELTQNSLGEVIRNVKISYTKRGFQLDPELHPRTFRAFKSWGKLMGEARYWGEKGKINKITLRHIENERRKLNAMIQDAQGQDKFGLIRFKATLDKWLDSAMDRALFSGDGEALEALKSARQLRTDLGNLFSPRGKSDTAGKIVEKILETNPTPEQTINYIIGAGRLGVKADAAKTIRRLENILGRDSAEFNALREAVWLRLAKDATGKARTPTMLAKQIDQAFQENGSLLRSLYGPRELDLIKRYKDAVVRTITPEDVRNPSRTAYTLARLMREFVGRIGTMMTFSGNPLGGAAMFALKRTPSMLGKRQARAAVRQYSPRSLGLPPFVAGGAALSEDITEGFEDLTDRPLFGR